MMKKTKSILAAMTCAALLAACAAPAAPAPASGNDSNNGADATEFTTIRIGASVEPHSEILRHVAQFLEVEGVLLDIIEFTDFVTLNPALVAGDVDANFFQHLPFLEAFMEDSGQTLVHHAYVFIAPLGFHSTQIDNIEDIPEGASIAIPNDVTNGARALNMIAYHGFIEIDPAAGTLASPSDITYNPLNLNFVPVDAPILPAALQDTGFAVINVAIALQAGMNPAEDAIARETAVDSPYRNVLVTREDNANDPAIEILAYWLNAETTYNFIQETYGGNMIPGF